MPPEIKPNLATTPPTGAQRERLLWTKLMYPEPHATMKRRTTFPALEPTEAEIQHAAYLIWIEDGRPQGRELEHWMTAKELLRHRPGRGPRGPSPVPAIPLPAPAA